LTCAFFSIGAVKNHQLAEVPFVFLPPSPTTPPQKKKRMGFARQEGIERRVALPETNSLKISQLSKGKY